jgi:hypothetical protein
MGCDIVCSQIRFPDRVGGGDDRVLLDHRESVNAALEQLQHYAQADTMRRTASRAIIVDAGRVTATGRLAWHVSNRQVSGLIAAHVLGRLLYNRLRGLVAFAYCC